MRSVECECSHDPASHYLDTVTNSGAPMPVFRNGAIVPHELVQVRMACLCRGCDCKLYVLARHLRVAS